MSDIETSERILKGKTVIVTGGLRGIGRAIAQICAREGASIGLNHRGDDERAAQVCRELEDKYNVRATPLPFDVRHRREMTEICDDFLEKAGPVDGWVNNAGVNRSGLFLTLEPEEIALQVDTNILGPIHGCGYILPRMMERRRGSIVNIGSVARFRPSRGMAVYAATKGALASLTLALAAEYGPKGIRLNCVEPGPVRTDMFAPTEELAGAELQERMPMRRFGSPHEIAEFVAFLLSDRAGYITGSLFNIDGGYSLG